MQLGKLHHINKNYEKALMCYEKAYSLDKGSPVIQFLLGQLSVYKKKDAVGLFKSVLKHDPSNYETLKILASLYQQKHEQGLANQCIEKMKTLMKSYHELENKKGGDDDYLMDPDVVVEMAKVVEDSDPKLALKCMALDNLFFNSSHFSDYYKVEKIYEKTGQPCPAELYNNIAVLLMATKELEKAEEYIVKEESVGSSSVSVLYNRARFAEMRDEIEKARKLYDDIIKAHPAYLDGLTLFSPTL